MLTAIPTAIIAIRRWLGGNPSGTGGSALAGVPRLIGPSAALRLLYSGEFLTAEAALGLGYVSAVVEPDELQERARAEARAFLVGSPFSHVRIKSLVYEGLSRDLGAHLVAHTAALAECFKSSDHVEGVASFLERRPAQFKGE